MAMTTWVGEESEVGVMASLVTPPHLPLTNHLPSINKKQKGKGGGVVCTSQRLSPLVMKSAGSTVGVISGRTNEVINCGAVYSQGSPDTSWGRIHNQFGNISFQ